MDVKNVINQIKELVRKGNVSKIVVRRKGEEVVSFPVNVGVVGAMVGLAAAKWAVLAAVLGTVGFGCSVQIVKDDGETVNVVTEDDTQKVKDTVVNIANDVKEAAMNILENERIRRILARLKPLYPEGKIFALSALDDDLRQQLNDAYETAGTRAIVTHRLPRNRDTSSARLSTIFEEINNSIFRRGHITLGLSSALMRSGVAYEFGWFKKHIMKVRDTAEDKELEAMLIHQQIYVDYFDQIYIYSENKREVEDFNRQRRNWIIEQFKTGIKNVRFLPAAVFNRQYDWVDKIIQWILMPRSILFCVVFTMCIVLPFIYFTLAIKWWIITIIWGFSLAFATPDPLVDKNWDKDFITLPIVTTKNIVTKIIRKIESIRKKKP